MKKTIYLLVLIVCAMVHGCDKRLETDVHFRFMTTAQGITFSGDTIVVDQGTDVTFLFEGNPDVITFYSGEPGSAYEHRNRYLLDPEEITSELRFSHYARYGTIIGAMSVMMSTEFEGLTGTDKRTDSLRIVNHEHWIDISDLCNMPVASNTVYRPVAIPMDRYMGRNVTLAFVYHPLNTTTAQPSWVISDLKIVNTSLVDGFVHNVPASSMGLTPFDMMAEDPDDVYLSVNRAGTWNLSSIGAAQPLIVMSVTGENGTLKYGWLVSQPMQVNRCEPDTGEGIKNITDRRKEYTHTYESTGTFTITFLARNENFKSSSEVLRQRPIKVVPVAGYGQEE